MTSCVNDGGPAFPSPDAGEFDYGADNRGAYPGMTLRDYFAAKAMQGMVSGTLASGNRMDPGDDAHIAKSAYMVADCMLNEAEK